MIVPNGFASIVLGLVYLIPFVVQHLVLRALFRAAKAAEECATMQKEQTELLRKLVHAAEGMEVKSAAVDAVRETTGRQQ